MDDEARRLAIRIEAREDFYFFVRRMFHARRGFRWAHNWHHAAICDALTRVFRGEKKRLVINIPPRYSKTEIAVVSWIAWALGHYPDAEFIHTSYSATLASSNAFAAKLLVQSEEYRDIFPGVHIRDDAKAKAHWMTTEGGVVYATGSGGTITGFGAGKMRPGFGGAIIIDDPHKADEADSDTVRKGVIDWFQNTLESRKNSPETPIVVIMQRLHESDLAGFLLAGGNGEAWEHLRIPAIGEDGAALWEAKHDLATLRTMERASPYVFAGQYQQRPAPLEGGEFKPDRIEVVDAVPAGTRLVRAWDLAGTKGGGDWTAGGLLGVAPDGRYVIADVVRVQESPEGVEATIRATATRDGAGVTVAIPQDPGQAGKAQVRALTRLLAGFPVSSKPVSGDKVTRARPLAAQINVGNVTLVRGAWNAALLEEMRNFPNGAHDDQIDALSLAFDELTGASTSVLDFYAEQAREEAALRSATSEVAGLFG
jgi:predicted phage terminase large subunit-like protein